MYRFCTHVNYGNRAYPAVTWIIGVTIDTDDRVRVPTCRLPERFRYSIATWSISSADALNCQNFFFRILLVNFSCWLLSLPSKIITSLGIINTSVLFFYSTAVRSDAKSSIRPFRFHTFSFLSRNSYKSRNVVYNRPISDGRRSCWRVTTIPLERCHRSRDVIRSIVTVVTVSSKCVQME